jgi:TPR repeat protein
MSRAVFLAVVVLLMANNSCTTTRDGSQPIAGVGDYNLSHVEIASLTRNANAGDSDSALRLYRYFEFVALDRPQALQWLERSASLENPEAQRTLGRFYIDDPQSAIVRKPSNG